MADTPYTKGFKAGMAWQRGAMIRKLEEADFSTVWRQTDWNPDGYESFGADEVIAILKEASDGPE